MSNDKNMRIHSLDGKYYYDGEIPNILIDMPSMAKSEFPKAIVNRIASQIDVKWRWIDIKEEEDDDSKV